MKIIFDTNKLKGLSFAQALILVFTNLANDTPVDNFLYDNRTFLQDNGLIDDCKKITCNGSDLLKEILSGDMSSIDTDSLTVKLREIYPTGKKPGTNYFWRNNPSEVKNKLKKFFQLYKDANITEEEVIVATEKYVKEMEYNTKMRLLKYFILKIDIEGEQNSDLYTYICGMREGEDTITFDSKLI